MKAAKHSGMEAAAGAASSGRAVGPAWLLAGGSRSALSAAVRAHEPAGALFVPGADPLLYYREVCNSIRPAYGCILKKISLDRAEIAAPPGGLGTSRESNGGRLAKAAGGRPFGPLGHEYRPARGAEGGTLHQGHLGAAHELQDGGSRPHREHWWARERCSFGVGRACIRTI